MNEKPITFTSDELQIEGLMYAAGPKGVVVTHPHPLYGGNMHNAVVETILQAFQDQGFSTLRFNFRGVGSSQGSYDNGIGEVQDIREAMNCLVQNGADKLYLTGYSFGAWVNAHLSPQETRDAPLIMVSPPVAFMDFENLKPLPNLKLVITGSRDKIAPDPMVREQMAGWNTAARLEIIPGADHFYSGCLQNLADTIRDATSSGV